MKDKSRRLSNTRGRTRGETRKANSHLSCRQLSFVLATLPNVAQSGSPATKTQRPSLNEKVDGREKKKKGRSHLKVKEKKEEEKYNS